MRTQSTLMERILQFSMPPVPSGTLEKAVEAFRDFICVKYPDYFYESKNMWFYNMQKTEDKGPFISNRLVKPVHLFWDQKNDSKHNPAWRIKIFEDNITLNLTKCSLSDSGDWDEIIALYNDLIIQLARGLNILQWKNIVATYVFAYGSRSISDKSLVTKDWIEVKKLLQPFANMTHAASFKKFIPDYRWNQTWICEPDSKRYIVNAQLNSENLVSSCPDDNKLEIRLFLSVQPAQIGKKIEWSPIYMMLKENYEALLTPYSRTKLMEDFK